MSYGGFFWEIVNLITRHATASMFIGLAYYLILFSPVYFMHRQKNLKIREMFACLARFIPTVGKNKPIH